MAVGRYMMLIISQFFLLCFVIYYLFIFPKKDDKNIVLLLKNFSTYQDINFPINENFDSQIAMLLKALTKKSIIQL